MKKNKKLAIAKDDENMKALQNVGFVITLLLRVMLK